MNYLFDEGFTALKLELKAIETYDERLQKWAEFTVDYCDTIARTKIDRSFYAFQSEPKFKPDVVIMGLNPYGKSSYESHYNNEGWGLKSFGKMTPEVFIHQNPWYIGGEQSGKLIDGKKPKEWNILKKLNITMNVHPELNKYFHNMVYMNVLYFNSSDFKEFQNEFKSDWKEVFDNCVKLTFLLISEVIKPKVVLCLGVGNCFRNFVGKNPIENILPPSLAKSTIDGIDIYGMTHPSARIANKKREEIGWHLYSELLDKSFVKVESL